MSEASEVIALSVVVPVFDEEENLAELDAEIRAVLLELGRPAEILYIDDASRDGSLALLESLARRADRRIRTRVVHLRRNYGQTAALGAGFDLAEGEVTVALDADGQNNPADIPRLLAELDRGYDVVSGWRGVRRDKALSRRLPSWVANRLISWLSGVHLHDYGCTLKAYRTPLLKEVRLYGEMHRFIPVYLSRLGARVGELKVDHRARRHGRSKYGRERVVKVLLDLVMIRFISRYFLRPMHFFGQTALWFALVVVFIGVTMLAFKYGWLRLVGLDYQASFIQTPLPALAASFIVGAILSLFFGILSEILVRVLHESQEMKTYAVGSILDTRSAAGDAD